MIDRKGRSEASAVADVYILPHIFKTFSYEEEIDNSENLAESLIQLVPEVKRDLINIDPQELEKYVSEMRDNFDVFNPEQMPDYYPDEDLYVLNQWGCLQQFYLSDKDPEFEGFDVNFVSKILGLSTEGARQCIDNLASSGFLEQEGGLYNISESGGNFVKRTYEFEREMIRT